MTIQIELRPEAAARLAQLSASHGMNPGEYAGRLLHSAIDSEVAPPSVLTVEEFRAMLGELAHGAGDMPSLPTEAFSRDSFYEGRP